VRKTGDEGDDVQREEEERWNKVEGCKKVEVGGGRWRDGWLRW
jgi:hypothetical protein